MTPVIFHKQRYFPLSLEGFKLSVEMLLPLSLYNPPLVATKLRNLEFDFLVVVGQPSLDGFKPVFVTYDVGFGRVYDFNHTEPPRRPNWNCHTVCRTCRRLLSLLPASGINSGMSFCSTSLTILESSKLDCSSEWTRLGSTPIK